MFKRDKLAFFLLFQFDPTNLQKETNERAEEDHGPSAIIVTLEYLFASLCIVGKLLVSTVLQSMKS